MSFQAYLENIKLKTGNDAAAFRKLAAEKGFTENGILKSEIKAAAIVEWLKNDYDLGHGHSMAIYALLKGIKNENSNS